jgi:AhpC/TSA family
MDLSGGGEWRFRGNVWMTAWWRNALPRAADPRESGPESGALAMSPTHLNGDFASLPALLLAALFMGAITAAAPSAAAAGAAPQIGQPAPEFTATDSKGNSLSLSQYHGKTVILEWTNAECPYTHKHYASGNMQSVQALAQKNGVVWLSVVSSAPGKQGYVNGPAADALTQSRGASPSAVLLDPSGTLGRLYAAKTTPHMFVIDKNGTLQYMGGIDSIATADASDIPRAEPYLKEAMLAVVQGAPVAHAVTKPYGCSIKY